MFSPNQFVFLHLNVILHSLILMYLFIIIFFFYLTTFMKLLPFPVKGREEFTFASCLFSADEIKEKLSSGTKCFETPVSK